MTVLQFCEFSSPWYLYFLGQFTYFVMHFSFCYENFSQFLVVGVEEFDVSVCVNYFPGSSLKAMNIVVLCFHKSFVFVVSVVVCILFVFDIKYTFRFFVALFE